MSRIIVGTLIIISLVLIPVNASGTSRYVTKSQIPSEVLRADGSPIPTLVAVPAPAAQIPSEVQKSDVNGDRLVDALDLAIVGRHLGARIPKPVAVAQFQGGGTRITAPFTVSGSPWELRWNNSSGFVQFFIVNPETGTVIKQIHYTGPDVSGTWLVFQTVGTFRLQVSPVPGSPQWDVTVVDHVEG